MKNIRKNILEKYVIFLLEELLNDSALKMLIAEKCYEHLDSSRKQSESYEKSLNAAIKEVDNKLNNIMKAIEAGIFNETTQQRMAELQDRKRQLKDELALEQNRRKYEIQKEDIIRFIDGFIGNLEDAAARDKVFSFLIDKIYVYEDRIVAVCFFSRDKREFSFENMAALIKSREKIMSILDSNDAQCYTEEQDNVMRAMCHGMTDGAETEETTSFC